MAKRVTYTVRVPVIRTYPTGAMRGTGMVVLEIVEDATLVGAMRAIDQAVERCDWYQDKAPTISPDPTEMGWPVK